MDGNPCWSITGHFNPITHWCTVYQFINSGLEMNKSIQLVFVLLTDMVATNMMDTYQDLPTCKDIYHCNYYYLPHPITAANPAYAARQDVMTKQCHHTSS